MGRTPTTPKTQEPGVVVNEERVQKTEAAVQQLASLQANYSEGRDLANQLLGQIQMSRAISKFTDVVSLSKLKQIKENKLYRGAAGQKARDLSGDEIPNVGTWEGFCRALGVSVAKVDEDLANLNTFGEEALNQLNSVGIGYRDLRQFRKLGEDEKTLLIEAAKSGDKDSLVEFAETLISKHTKEKEALEARATSAEADKEASEQLLTAKDKKLNELARKAAKFSFETDWPAQVGAAVEVVDKYASEAEKFLGIVMQACSQAMEAAPKDEATQQVWAHGAAALAARVRDAMARQKEVIAAADAHFASTLGLYLED